MKTQRESSYNKFFYLRMATPVVFTVFAFIFVLFFVFLPYHKQSMLNSRKLMIRELVETAWSIINNGYELSVHGLLTEEDAKGNVLSHVKKMRYGKEGDGYFWIHDLDAIMLMHPYRKDLAGKSVYNFEDSSGKFIAREAIEEVKARGEGYIEYMWPGKNNPKNIVSKVSYVKLFKPWGWIVGTGIYVEELDTEIDGLLKELIEKCLEILLIVVILLMYGMWQIIKIEEARKEAGEKLRQKEEMFRAITEKATDITLIFDRDRRIKYITPAALRGFKLKEADVLGAQYFDFIHPDDLDRIKQVVENADVNPEKSGHVESFRIFDGEGDIHYLEGCYTYLYDQPEINGVVFNGRDITEKKEAEQKVLEVDARCKRIFENALEGIAIASQSTKKFKHVNPALCRMLGYSREEFLSIGVEDVHPKGSLEFIFSAFEAQAKGEQDFAKDIPCLRKGGETIFCDITAFSLILDGEMCNVGFFTDVTESRKIRQELEEYRQHLEALVDQKSKELVLSEKLAVTGRFAAGIAHEINNPLQGMMVNLDALKDSFVDSTDNNECYEYIKGSINRIKHVVSQLLDIYRDRGHSKIVFEINPLIENVVSFMSRQAKSRGIVINMNLDKKSPKIKGWRQQIYQVILNLIINAMDSSANKKVINVSSTKDGNMVVIVVADEGRGIKGDNLDKIFEPFFSDGKPSGVGLGLFVCKGLIDNHEGTIEVYSKEDEGTRFIIKFPAV